MTLAALFFDLDGTLADTEPEGHLPAYNRAFADFGLDWHWSRALYRDLLLTPGGRERIAHYLQAYAPALDEHEQRVKADRAQWIHDLHQCKSRYFSERLACGAVTLRPGVARLIHEANTADVPVAIVTNASRGSLEPVLEHLLGPELTEGVAFSVCGDEVDRKKPAPNLYRLACERLHCRPADCVAVEDSATGLNASHGAGIPTLITVNSDTRGQSFPHARAVVDGLGEPGAPVSILRSPGFGFEYVDLDVMGRLGAR